MLGLGNSVATEHSFHRFNSYSIRLDGTNECVNLGNSSDIKLTATNTDTGEGISVSAWIKYDAWDGTNSGYQSGTMDIVSCTSVGGWNMTIGTRIGCYLNIADNGGNKYLNVIGPYKVLDSGDQSYRASGGFHVCMTFDGRTLKLYVNGREETDGLSELADADSGADDTPILYAGGNDNTDVLIGGDPGRLVGGASGSATLAGNAFRGKIDQVAIWNKALPVESVLTIFNYLDDAVTNDPLRLYQNYDDYTEASNLVGYWTFDAGTGTEIEDENGGITNNPDLLLNYPTFSTDLPY